MSIYDILEDIGSDTKRSHKQALIEKHKENKLFLSVLTLALDPYTNFYIRQIPSYVPVQTGTSKTLDWALVELEKLSSRQFTGHAGIEHLRSILGSVSANDAIVVERIIGKDLRCGAGDGTVNSVIKNFIRTYPCLLARPYDAKNIKNIVFPAYSQLKADGLRTNIHVNGNKVTICGRSGRDIDLLGHMDEEFIKLGAQYPYPVVFDGELVVVDDNGIVSRKVGNGIINKAIKGTISDEEAKMVRAQLWDAIPLSEFQAGVSTQDYKTRFEGLLEAIKAAAPSSEDALVEALKGITRKYWAIPCKVVNSLQEGVAHFEELLAQGEEGTILKNFCALWEDTRSKHLVKMKAEKDCDLEILGFNPGEGKFTGQVGSLICASSDRLVEVAISGFSDPLRQKITNDINNLIGTIVTVTYNERIKSQTRTGVDSLFLPRFNEFRQDKKVADSTKEIK
jgi:DNA ligase-1